MFVGQISSEMHAAQLMGYLLLKCDSNDKVCVCMCMCVFVCVYVMCACEVIWIYMCIHNAVQLSVVVNMFHEMSVVHSRLANTTFLCAITQLLPETPGDLITLTRNVLTLVQLPKSSAKQLQVK